MAFSSQSFTAPSIKKLNRRTISSPLSSSVSKISGVTPKLKTSRMRFFRPSLKKTNVTAEEITQKSSIENTLVETNTILVEIQKQLSLDFAMRIAEEKERNKVLKSDKSRRRLALKEDAIESTRRIGNIVKSATSKILAPVKSVFDKIMEFLSIIGAGIAANAVFEWLKDSENKQKLQGWFNFIVEHWKWGLAALGAVAALNLVGPISALVKVLKVAGGLFAKGIPLLLKLLASKAFLAAAGLVVAPFAIAAVGAFSADAIRTKLSGGDAFRKAHNLNAERLAKETEDDYAVNEFGKFRDPSKSRRSGLSDVGTSPKATEGMKAAYKDFKDRQSKIDEIRDQMRAEMDAEKAKLIPDEKHRRGYRVSLEAKNKSDANVREKYETKLADLLSTQIQPRAMGGPVTAGNPYVVGEKGPELFVPNINGSVVNNYKTEKIYNMISSKNAGKINFITMDLPPQVIKKEKSIPTPPAPSVPNISSKNALDLWRVKTPDIYGIYV